MTRPPDDEAFVQAAFSGLPAVEPSLSLTRRVAQLPLTHGMKSDRSWLFRNWWLPVGWALAGALGVVSGTFTLDELEPLLTEDAQSSYEAWAPVADEVPADDLDAILTLAWGDEEAQP